MKKVQNEEQGSDGDGYVIGRTASFHCAGCHDVAFVSVRLENELINESEQRIYP